MLIVPIGPQQYLYGDRQWPVTKWQNRSYSSHCRSPYNRRHKSGNQFILHLLLTICHLPSLQVALACSHGSSSFIGFCGNLSSTLSLLCAGQVPVVPIHTTTAMCGTAVRSSLGSARLPQWSKTQAYASNVYYSVLSQAVALDRRRVSWARL